MGFAVRTASVNILSVSDCRSLLHMAAQQTRNDQHLHQLHPWLPHLQGYMESFSWRDSELRGGGGDAGIQQIDMLLWCKSMVSLLPMYRIPFLVCAQHFYGMVEPLQAQ